MTVSLQVTSIAYLGVAATCVIIPAPPSPLPPHWECLSAQGEKRGRAFIHHPSGCEMQILFMNTDGDIKHLGNNTQARAA